MKRDTLERLNADRAAKRAVVLASRIGGGAEALLYPPDCQSPVFGAEIATAAREALQRDKSGPVAAPDGQVFLNVFNSPLRMVIVGAVHIAQALARMAAQTGYDVTIIDPRRAFATEDRFPGVALRHDWPDEALAEIRPDHRTAVITLTHDPKIDDPALIAALKSPCFYVGALGSKKTHAKRVERLTAEGVDEASIGRIHGPVGLSLGAVSPAEIAVSILGQVIARLRGAAA
ncbi:MAG: xanthine dehydrogenase [Alphaproteobacteria bacterium]|nr:xanthine dehydrogenase [Alphaproteobacteria bacterium]